MQKTTKKEIIKIFSDLKNKELFFISAKLKNQIDLDDIKKQLEQVIEEKIHLKYWNKKENLEVIEKSNFLLLNNSRLDLTNCNYYIFKDFIIVSYYKTDEIVAYKIKS